MLLNEGPHGGFLVGGGVSGGSLWGLRISGGFLIVSVGTGGVCFFGPRLGRISGLALTSEQLDTQATRRSSH
jgi:hypothetical protein